MNRYLVGTVLAVGVAGAGVSPMGCSSSSTPTTAGDGGDAATGTGTLSVVVVTPKGGTPEEKLRPVANAAVQLEIAGAEPQTATTGADGRVTFKGIDWSKGKAAVTGYADGFAMYSIVDVTPETLKKFPVPPDASADATLFLFERGSSAFPVTLQGDVKSKADAANSEVISCSRCMGAYERNTPSYGGLRARREAAVVYVREYKDLSAPPSIKLETAKWARFDLPAPTADMQTFDIDLAAGTQLTTTLTHVRYEPPGGVGGPLTTTGRALAIATTGESQGSLLTGLIASSAPTTDGAFEVTLESTPVDAALDPYVNYVLATQELFTQIVKFGPPEDNITVSGFLMPPIVTVQTQTLADPVAIEGAPPDIFARVVIAGLAGEAVWLLDTTSDVTELHIPKFPAIAESLKTKIRTGQIIFLSDNDAKSGIYKRAAGGRTFTMKP
jgi:hypothetical protein